MSKIGITERGDAALDLGWTQWVQVQKKPAILITKNPKELNGYLDGSENVIIHCTVTGLGGTKLEPNVPAIEKSEEGMAALKEKFGAERIILRIDPIVPYEPYLSKHLEAYEKCKQHASRVRISFMDMYTHVIQRLKDKKLRVPYKTKHAPIKDRIAVWKKLGCPEICGEPEMKCTGCISLQDCLTLKILPEFSQAKQRKECKCLGNKQELLKAKKQCAHGCVYCYWLNTKE